MPPMMFYLMPLPLMPEADVADCRCFSAMPPRRHALSLRHDAIIAFSLMRCLYAVRAIFRRRGMPPLSRRHTTNVARRRTARCCY